jgi:hypothetical protein
LFIKLLFLVIKAIPLGRKALCSPKEQFPLGRRGVRDKGTKLPREPFFKGRKELTYFFPQGEGD